MSHLSADKQLDYNDISVAEEVPVADLKPYSKKRKKLLNKAWNSSNTKSQPWGKLRDVSVSGLQAVLDKKSPPLRRVVWTCLLAVCFSLMLAQCSNRIRHYLDEPIKVRVRVVRNSSLHFPAVTMCNKNAFNYTAALLLMKKYHLVYNNISNMKVSQLIGRAATTPSSLWSTLAHDLDVFIVSCWFSRGLKCYQRGNWTQVFTVFGPCYTFMLNEVNVKHVGRFHNLFLRLIETTPIANESGVRILVHERDELPVIDIFTKGYTIDLGWSREVKLELRKFQQINSRRSHCNDVRSYSQNRCTIACLEDHIIRSARCRLPFMSASKDTIGECSSPTTYEIAMNITSEILLSKQWTANCSCPRQCIQTQFLIYPENEGFLPHEFKTRIYYEALVFEQITEERNYSLISLLCDIGSTFGLLMGVSVLTMCELVEVAYSYLTSCRAKSRLPSPPATAIKLKY